jgi:hypothetical protein
MRRRGGRECDIVLGGGDAMPEAVLIYGKDT